MINRRWVHSGPPNYPFVLNQESQQAKGLVAWWPMIGNFGSNVLRDFTRNGDGAFSGGAADPSWANEAIVGSTLVFNGTSTNIDIPAFQSTNNLSEFTAVAYVNLVSPGNGGVIFEKIQTSAVIGWLFWADSAQRLRGYVYTNGTDALSVATNTPSNEMIHAVMTYSDTGNRQVNLYINGLEVSSYILQTTATGLLGDDSPKNFRIGVDLFGGYLEASLGDCRVYNRVLPPIEIYQLYASQTRWELYQPLHRLIGLVPPPPPIDTIDLTLQNRDLALALQNDRDLSLTLPSRPLSLTIPER
jgi:hypothetical protein